MLGEKTLHAPPEIVLLEDQEIEIEGMLSVFKKTGFSYKVINPDNDRKPESPFSSAKLLIIDLIYGQLPFDSDIVVGWIQKIIPENLDYQMIIWSRHSEKVNEIIAELSKIKRAPKPDRYIALSKQHFRQHMGYNCHAALLKVAETINGFSKNITTRMRGQESELGQSLLSSIPQLPASEHPDFSEAERRIWRAYFEVIEINEEKQIARILIPSWSNSELVNVPFEKFPSEIKPKVNDYFFAKLNKGATEISKLIIQNIEIPRKPGELYAKLIHP